MIWTCAQGADRIAEHNSANFDTGVCDDNGINGDTNRHVIPDYS